MALSADVFEIQHCTDVQCVLHLHTEPEFVLVTSGTLQVLLTDRRIRLQPGDGYYVMPLEVHGYATETHSTCTILVFSPGLVPDFTSATSNRCPHCSSFCASETVRDLCAGLEPRANYDMLHKRAVLYPICSEIVDRCGFVMGDYRNEESIIRAERYILQNMAAKITLKSAAAALGLNPSYLSRMFHKVKGVEFWKYINILRCSSAACMLTAPSSVTLSVSEIAYECGFESIRTFNRVFKEHFGVTPSEMRIKEPISFPGK